MPNTGSSMLGLDITPLKPGLHELELAPAAEDLDLDPAAFSDLRVAVRLDLTDERALVQFEARATATLECDRTLQPFTEPISGRHTVLFATAHPLQEAPSDDPDVLPLPEPGIPLDLTAPVRDTLLLALPVRRLAPGADERALPLVFGALTDDDGNPIDPRWEALRSLRGADPDRS